MTFWMKCVANNMAHNVQCQQLSDLLRLQQVFVCFVCGECSLMDIIRNVQSEINAVSVRMDYHQLMDLRHLRYFVAAAEEAHFGRAAGRLHVTRPAISQLIADLERSVGVRLFERRARSVELTAAGRAFLPPVKALLRDVGLAVEIARRADQGLIGHLNIGYNPSALIHPILHDTVKSFRESYPEVILELVELPSHAQLVALKSGAIQAGFGYELKDQDEAVASLRIQDEFLGIALPNHHPLAGKRSIRISDLSSERFIVLPRSVVGAAYARFHSLCLECGFEPNIVQRVSNNLALLTFVSAGMGIGLMHIGRNMTYPTNTVVRKLSGLDQTEQFQLMWPAHEKGAVVENFVAVVRSSLGSMGRHPAPKPEMRTEQS